MKKREHTKPVEMPVRYSGIIDAVMVSDAAIFRELHESVRASAATAVPRLWSAASVAGKSGSASGCGRCHPPACPELVAEEFCAESDQPGGRGDSYGDSAA